MRQNTPATDSRIRCLTEISATVLAASALGVSALLWLAIFAVI